MSASLSFSAEQLVDVLERKVLGQAPATAWLRALVDHDPDLARAASPDTDVATLAAGDETGGTVTRADVEALALARADDQGRPVAGAGDIAAVLVTAIGSSTEAGVTSPPPEPASPSEPAPPTDLPAGPSTGSAVPLSFSAEELAASLASGRQGLHELLVSLADHHPDLLATPDGPDVVGAARRRVTGGDPGPVWSLPEIGAAAGSRAAADDRPIATTGDVAAALVNAARGLLEPAPPPEPLAEPTHVEAPSAEPTVEVPVGHPGAAEPERIDLAGAGRTFRLFVSSTFTDLQDERNALHQRVFPELRRLCARHGARFQVIDLRWGVSTEAGLDQKTMPLCLGEIERCQRHDRPNFLVLLGDRYGWRPLPATIPADELDAIVTSVPDELPHPAFEPAPAGTRSPSFDTWQRTPVELLKEWYLLDTNAVPAEYVLAPRAGDGDYGLGPDGFDTEDWRRVEHYLGAILRDAVARLGFDDHAAARYEASATEQEITKGALEVPDADQHVFCFFRTITGLPHDESSATFEGIGHGGPDRDATERLTRLRERLSRHVPDNIERYEVPWLDDEARPSNEHLDRLCADVLDHLSAAIRTRFAGGADATAAELEEQAHVAFARDRARVFIGRTATLDVVADHLARRPGRPLVVHGPSGSGKSALMAKAALSTPDADRVVRFVGATATSSDGRSLLADLCRRIGVLYGEHTEVPVDYRELVQEFPRRLALATPERPLTVFVDALDQLAAADPARRLAWLPDTLPDHVALVVSTLPGDTLDTLLGRHPAPEAVEVEPMTVDEAEDLLAIWLDEAGRTLEPDQRAEVLESFRHIGLPLYLKLAFEEARLWRSGAPHVPLAPDVTGVISDNLLDRLEHPDNHGEVLVSHALGYLAASRYGMAEDELLSVLSADADVMGWLAANAPQGLPEVAPGEQRLPVVLWARLYADLAPYLTERAAEGATVLGFYHRQFAEAARDLYVRDGQGEVLHERLAAYFRSTIDPHGDGTWSGAGLRGLSELPYHLTEAGDFDGVEEVLTDFGFLERKVAEVGVIEQTDVSGDTKRVHTGVYELQSDFDHALRAMGGEVDEPRRRIIVTAVDLGDGLEIRCPHCNRMIPWDESYRGTDIACPLTGPDCGGPLRVNPFVVGESATG